MNPYKDRNIRHVIRYVEDGNVRSVEIDPWRPFTNNFEVLLWDFANQTKGIFRKKVLKSMIVTNFRIMAIDHENNRLNILHLIPNLDDVIVMNTHRVSDSIGYAVYTGRYSGMAGPRFSSGRSKTVGDIFFLVNGQKSSWIGIPDPNGLKSLIKSIKKTMYDPLTMLEAKTKPPRGGINCPDCGSHNPKNAQFCNGCGSKLLQICPNCKQRNPIDASFCNKCGSQLSTNITIDLSEKGVTEVVEQSFRECILKEYKIKINYPSTWTRAFDIDPPNPAIKAMFKSPQEGPTDQVIETVAVCLDDTVGNMTLGNYVEASITTMSQDKTNKNFKLIESKPTTLSGIPAQQIIYSANERKTLVVVAIWENVSYMVMYMAEPSKYLKFLSSVEQMISSFQFLDSGKQ